MSLTVYEWLINELERRAKESGLMGEDETREPVQSMPPVPVPPEEQPRLPYRDRDVGEEG